MTDSRCDSDYSRQALSTNSICSIKSYTEIPLYANAQKSNPKLNGDIRTSLLPLDVIVHPRPPINYTVIKKDYYILKRINNLLIEMILINLR